MHRRNVCGVHLRAHKVRPTPEGVCGGKIHYFSFCLLLLCSAQPLNESDQPTITIHNGFSASSTSLEACLRFGWGYPRVPRSTPLPIPVPPASSPSACVFECVHVWPDGYGMSMMCVCAWEFGAVALNVTAEDPIEKDRSQPVHLGPLSLSDHATTEAPGMGRGLNTQHFFLTHF